MASRDLDCEKVDHLIVPEAPSPKAHALTELGQDALLPQMLNDQHDFAKPRRRRGNGVRRGLDDDRRIGDTGHVYLLVRKDVYPSSREAHFMSARYKLHLVAQFVGDASTINNVHATRTFWLGAYFHEGEVQFRGLCIHFIQATNPFQLSHAPSIFF